MDDSPFTFHAVFHVVVFIVVHGLRARQGAKANRKQKGVQNRNSAMPPSLRVRTINTSEQQLKRKESP
jgi:hypothetical protein